MPVYTGLQGATLGRVGLRSRVLGGAPVDPLAGIPLSLRLQLHNFQSGTPQQTVTVADSPDANADAGYVLVSGAWVTAKNGSNFTNTGPGSTVWMLAVFDSSGSNVANYTGVGGDSSNPSTVLVWSDIGGPISISVTTQLSPFYLPFGMFQDAACTTPSLLWGDPIGGWKDMFTAGNPVASQSNAMNRLLLQFAPNGSGVWVPVVVGNGTSSILEASLAFTTNDISVFGSGQKSSAGGTSNKYSRFACFLNSGDPSIVSDYGNTNGWTGIGITSDPALAPDAPAAFTFRNLLLIAETPITYSNYHVLGGTLSGGSVTLSIGLTEVAGTTAMTSMNSDLVRLFNNGSSSNDSFLNGSECGVLIGPAMAIGNRTRCINYLTLLSPA